MPAKRNPVWLFPHTAERNYQRLMRSYTQEITKETLSYLKGLELLRNDGWSDDFSAAVLYLLERFLGIGQRVTARLPEMYAQVNQYNDRQFRAITKAGTGLEIGPSSTLPPGSVAYGNVADPRQIRARFGVGVDVYRSEPWLAEAQTNWVAANTSLIKSIPAQHMERVEQIVRNGVLNGESPKSLAAKIQAAGGVTQRRAELIASDQISKANAELNKFRQQELGIEKYTWVSSHDERVRALHKQYDGNVYEWDKPPADGHPGMPIRCRCHASPVFPD